MLEVRNLDRKGVSRDVLSDILHTCGFEMPKRFEKASSQVATIDTVAVGVLLSSAHVGPSHDPSLYMEYLAVLPAFQHRGIGTLLLFEFMKRHGLESNVQLDCFEDSLETFQARFGFQVFRRKAEMAHGEPELRTSMVSFRWIAQLPQLQYLVGHLRQSHKSGSWVREGWIPKASVDLKVSIQV